MWLINISGKSHKKLMLNVSVKCSLTVNVFLKYPISQYKLHRQHLVKIRKTLFSGVIQEKVYSDLKYNVFFSLFN